MDTKEVAQQIMEEIKARKNDAKSATILLGELSTINQHELLYFLGELDRNLKANIILEEALIFCESCGYKGKPQIQKKDENNESTIWKCPECKALLPKPTQGDKVKILELE
jgi:Zn finger protein HypA/HybF involved in hydrogenase expression